MMINITVVLTLLLCVKAYPASSSPDQKSLWNLLPPVGSHQKSFEHSNGAPDDPFYSKGKYTLHDGAEEVCPSYGEKQWTGTVDVSDTSRFFFWFAQSRNSPETDPVIVWMNGGPGASSLLGLFGEIGPCLLDSTSNSTRPNAFAWNQNASVLFLDQPAGAGFSSRAAGAPHAQTDHDSAEEFQFFLNVFFDGIFPNLAALPIHLAAESYGGHFAPTYLHHILSSQAVKSEYAFTGKIESLIMVNALVDISTSMIGSYELLCSSRRDGEILTEPACSSMAALLPECERLSELCRVTEEPVMCQAALDYCLSKVATYYIEEQMAGRRSPYHVDEPCLDFPLCSDPDTGNVTQFLNEPQVLSALGFKSSFIYRSLSWEVYNSNKDMSRNMYKTVGSLMDWDMNHMPYGGKAPRVLVINGNSDWIVNTPGVVLAYDRLRWSGQAGFRTAQWRSWGSKHEGIQELDGSGFWKQSSDGRLVLVGVDGAGHAVPHYYGQGSLQILNRWFSGWS